MKPGKTAFIRDYYTMIAASCHQIIECIIRTFDRDTGHRPPVPLPQGRHLEDRKKAVRKNGPQQLYINILPKFLSRYRDGFLRFIQVKGRDFMYYSPLQNSGVCVIL